MSKHSISWYKPGRKIVVRDKMQNYTYTLTESPGKKFADDFKPDLTPQQMLALGVFEGKYMNDCEGEFPKEWYAKAKTSDTPDVNLNLFKIKSRLSLQEWRKRGWIPIIEGDKDVRGWFQWYCRYWIGRRMPDVDRVQIARWNSFKRHRGQIIKSIKNMKPADRPKTKAQLHTHRPRQRQALLQWAYNPYITTL